MAIRLSSHSPSAVLFSNRSAAHSGMRFYGRALEDADQAVALEGGNAKYHVRRGTALLGMGEGYAQEAADAFERAMELSPGYEAAMAGLREAKTKLARTNK